MEPKQGLTYGMVADNFGNDWFAVQPLPELQIRLLPVSEASEKQAGLPHRQVIEVFHVMWEWP